MSITSMEQFMNMFGRHPVSVFLEDPSFFTCQDYSFTEDFLDHVMMLAETFCHTFREGCH